MSEPKEQPREDKPGRLLPVEVEVYIEPDGSVTFADLEAQMLPVAYELNPGEPLACDVPPAEPDEDAGGVG